MILLLLILSIIPIFLIAFYIYEKDTVKEPKTLLVKFFVSGVFATFFVILVNVILFLFFPKYYLFDNYHQYSLSKLFIYIFFEIAIVEELSKWIMIRVVGYNNKEFDQVYDMIVYSVFVSLGFAAFENVFYVVSGGFSVGILRAIFSVPGHVAFGIFMGYFFGMAKTYKDDKFKNKFYMFLAIFIPSVFHAIYDFCLFNDNFWFLLIFIGFVIILYFQAILKVNEVSKNDKLID